MKLRRIEFRQRRNAKRGWRRRHPLPRILKECYNSIHLGSLLPPSISHLIKGDEGRSVHWGGRGHYFDVVASGPPTTRVTSKDAVSVNYGEPGAASWRGKYG